jgi:hypothetical protein
VKHELLLATLTLCVTYGAKTQSTTPGIQTPCATAAQGTVGNFTISYTIGEMPLVESWKQNGLFITQGVLQPVKGIADSTHQCFSAAEVNVYPNPNPGSFQLQLSIFKHGQIQINLLDASGKSCMKDEFSYNGFTTRPYNISRLGNGVYFLQLIF